MPRNAKKRRCGARTWAGEACGSWARRESDPPRCAVHDGGRPAEDGSRQCVGVTKAGERCRGQALVGREVCVVHAGVMAVDEKARAAGRVCTAMAKRGERCGNWAVRDSAETMGRALCRSHARSELVRGKEGGQRAPAGTTAPIRLTPAAGKRCEAVTGWGQQCRNWAKWDSRAGRAAKALCAAHARPAPLREASERRCAARTRAGGRCRNWAVRGTKAQYGRRLCIAHLPEGDARKSGGRLPEEGRRCVARTWEGKRCKRWARREPEARGMCEHHAYPRQNPRIRHGYYRRVPYFTEAQKAFFVTQMEEGELQMVAVALLRLKLRDVLAYLNRPDLSEGERVRATEAILKGAAAVARLLLAQKKLAHLRWGPGLAGGTGALLGWLEEEE